MTKKIQIPEKFLPLLDLDIRYKVFYGGRGGAKSHNFARALLIKGMQSKMRFVCAREIQKSIKDSVHRLLSDIILEHGLTHHYTVLENEIRGKNGTIFMFRGLKHNTTDLKSLEGADIIWIEEAENVSNSSYEIVIPTIRKETLEEDGTIKESEIWISFNTKNVTDPTYQRFIAKPDDDVYVQKVSWRDNPFFPGVLEKERLKLQREDPEAYEHIWEGMPDTRRSGVVYAKQMNKAREDGRICRVPYDPSFEVFTAWDLGYGDSTAIWFLQFVGRELRWIDYYENSGEFLPHYALLVKNKPYVYSKHYLPHDGGANNVRGAKPSKQLADLGLPNYVLPRTSLASGIDETRKVLAYSVFDAQKTKDGIHTLDNYHYEWDEDRQMFKKDPYHDWSEHGASAARYAALAAAIQKGSLLKDTTPTHRRRNTSSTAWMG